MERTFSVIQNEVELSMKVTVWMA